jgi:hypothetical protein
MWCAAAAAVCVWGGGGGALGRINMVKLECVQWLQCETLVNLRLSGRISLASNPPRVAR